MVRGWIGEGGWDSWRVGPGSTHVAAVWRLLYFSAIFAVRCPFPLSVQSVSSAVALRVPPTLPPTHPPTHMLTPPPPPPRHRCPKCRCLLQLYLRRISVAHRG